MFSTLPITDYNFSVASILSSGNALSLDQSEMLSFGKELMDHGSFMIINP